MVVLIKLKGKVANTFLLLFGLLWFNQLLAQNKVLIDFSAKNISIETAIKTICENYQLTYSYNPELFNDQKLVSCKFKQKPVDVALLELINEPSVKVKQIGKSVIITQKKQHNYLVKLFVVNYRTNMPLAQARVVANGYKFSWLTDTVGETKIGLTTYADSVKITIGLANYITTSVYLKPNETFKTVKLLPDELEFPTIPSMPFSIVEEPVTASIDQNFFVKAITMEEVINEANNDSVDATYRLAQVSFIPPLGTNGLQSGKITNNFSLNLFTGYANGLEGLELAGFINIIKTDVKGIQLAGFGNIVGNKVFGMQASGFFNIAKKDVVGLQLAGFNNISSQKFVGIQAAGFNNVSAGYTNGIQIAGFNNVSSGKFSGIQAAGFHNTTAGGFYGIQAAGFINTASKYFYGIQTSGFLNVHAGNFNGFQISAFGNFSKDLNGFQIAGFVNKARKVNGFQIGFINIADSVKGIPIGFLNIVKHGIHSLEFGYNEMNMVSGLFRTGIYGFHNVFYGAVEPVDGKKEFAVGYGLGSAFKPSKQTMVDFTALVIQRSQNYNITNNVNLIFRASPHLAFGFKNGPYVYFGPSFNVFITQPINKTPDISIGQIAPKNYYSLQIPEEDFRSWAGFDVGIRF